MSETVSTTPEGVTIYLKDGKRHRIGGPAYIEDNINGLYQYGELHRFDGPAMEHLSAEIYGWEISLKAMEELSTEELMEWIICYSHNSPDKTVSEVKNLIELKK